MRKQSSSENSVSVGFGRYKSFHHMICISFVCSWSEILSRLQFNNHVKQIAYKRQAKTLPP